MPPKSVTSVPTTTKRYVCTPFDSADDYKPGAQVQGRDNGFGDVRVYICMERASDGKHYWKDTGERIPTPRGRGRGPGGAGGRGRGRGTGRGGGQAQMIAARRTLTQSKSAKGPHRKPKAEQTSLTDVSDETSRSVASMDWVASETEPPPHPTIQTAPSQVKKAISTAAAVPRIPPIRTPPVRPVSETPVGGVKMLQACYNDSQLSFMKHVLSEHIDHDGDAIMVK